MKQIKFYLILICIIALGIFTISCDELGDVEINPEPTTYSVTFTVDGKTYESKITEGGRAVSKPNKEPTKENHKFSGWYTDGDVIYDFSKPVTKSLTLYAKFELDMEALNEGIEKLKYSIVKVENKCFNSEDMSDAVVEKGIGIIFNISNGHCFLITNNHTIGIKTGYANQIVTVQDYTGTTHNALFYKGANKPHRASSSEYDLAVICFPYNRSDLKVASYMNNTPEKDDIVISVGSTVDKVSHGTVTDIAKKEANMEEYLSDVEFNVIHHNAIPDDGINESLLFDLKLVLVGITYQTENGEAYAIPYSKIVEFLNEYVYN